MPARRRLPILLALAGLAVIGAVLVGVATPYGPGLRDDSFTYLSAADGLASTFRYGRITGDGTFKPITNFPPMYSMALASFRALGDDLVGGGRHLNQILFGMLVILSGAYGFLATRSLSVALAASLLILSSDVLLRMATWVLSETMFLSILLAGMTALVAYLGRPRRVTFIICALLFALALLTRYAALPFVLATAILLSGKESDNRSRWKTGGIFLLLTGLPLAVFAFRNWALVGNLANRPTPYWHPPSGEALEIGARTIVRWIMPERLLAALSPGTVYGVLAAGILLFGMTLAWCWKEAFGRQDDRHVRAGVLALVLGAVSYVAFLLVSVTVFDVLTPIDDRLLSPLYMMTILLVPILLAGMQRIPRIFVLVGFAAFIAFQGYRQAVAVAALMQDGQGYSASVWRESQALDYTCGHSQVPIYSNDLPAVYFRCGRMAVALPSRINLASGLPNPAYEAERKAMLESVQHQGAIIVFVGWYGSERLQRTGFDDLVVGLKPLMAFDDGIVYAR